jgi:hypothetical protein
MQPTISETFGSNEKSWEKRESDTAKESQANGLNGPNRICKAEVIPL